MSRPQVPVLLVWCVLAGLVPSAARAEPSGSSVEDGDQTLAAPQLVRQATLRYPDAAAEQGLHGDVAVLVDVGSDGTVVSVRVESGPEVFHAAAREAARSLLFEPARRGDTPVAATIRVFFHFAPPEPAHGAGHDGSEGEPSVIVVHGEDAAREDTRPHVRLGEAQLEEQAGDGFAEAIDRVAGVRQAGGTTDAAKPIIRGQSERRLLVLQDGIRHESQKWGPDHATEIDPFSAGAIRVIRGAAGARYGPDAIGGVILVEPPAMRAVEGVGGKALLAYHSNGRRPYGALRLDVAPLDDLTLRLEGNATQGAALRTPDYVLGNTASTLWNLAGAAEYRWSGGSARITWRHHDFRAGVFYGVRTATPDAFLEQLQAERPVGADAWTSDRDIDAPYQDVTHDLASFHLSTVGEHTSLELTYAFQLNRRLEVEPTRDSVTDPQYDFTLRTHTVDALLRHLAVDVGSAELTGGIGVQGRFQENVYQGLPLLPNARELGGGLFAFERASFSRVDVEVGARLDHLSRAAFLRENDLEAHVRRGSLTPSTCEPTSARTRCPSTYTTASVSAGALVHAVPERLDLKLDLSTASRFPNLDELYLIGSAPTFPVQGYGFPDLRAETSFGGSATVGVRLPAVQAELSGFGTLIDDYIYFAPELGDDGTPRLDVTARGAFPRYTYRPIQAVSYGADGSIDLGPDAAIGGLLRGSLVRTQDAATGEHLVFTPADQLHIELIGRPRVPSMTRLELAVTTDLVARQSRVDPARDLAPAPDGYALLGLRADAALPVGDREVRLGLTAHNLLDTAYRDYTSLLRYYADQPGRDVRVRIGMDI